MEGRNLFLYALRRSLWSYYKIYYFATGFISQKLTRLTDFQEYFLAIV